MLDLFHRSFFERNQGRIAPMCDPRCRAITNEMNGPRLTSTIEYANGSTETMQFELFSPEEIQRRAAATDDSAATKRSPADLWTADWEPVRSEVF